MHSFKVEERSFVRTYPADQTLLDDKAPERHSCSIRLESGTGAQGPPSASDRLSTKLGIARLRSTWSPNPVESSTGRSRHNIPKNPTYDLIHSKPPMSDFVPRIDS
jgi:hypothetical protein